jgi:hypothetical protein
MFLMSDALAVAILGSIEPALFRLGDMSIVLGFIHRLTLGNVGIMGLVASRLLAGHAA